MVRLVVVRICVSVLADRQAPSWAWSQQVHLVRFDKYGTGLPLQPVRNTREVIFTPAQHFCDVAKLNHEIVDDAQAKRMASMKG